MAADVEAVVVAWLPAQLEETRCVTELPANLPDELPVVQIARIGGPTIGRLDRAVVDLDGYESTLIRARGLILVTLEALTGLAGQKVDGATVTRVDIVSGPATRPYDNTRVRRVGATVQLTVLSRTN